MAVAIMQLQLYFHLSSFVWSVRNSRLNLALQSLVNGTFHENEREMLSPIANMTFIKHDYSKPKEKRRSLLPPGKDVRAPHQMQWSEERVKNMLILVKQYQEKNNCVAGWSHILPQDAVLESDSNEKEEKNRGSCR